MLTKLTIKARQDAYGQDEFDLLDASTGYLVRGSICTYKLALEIAERIEGRWQVLADAGLTNEDIAN